MKIGFALIPSPPFFHEIIRIENELHQTAGFLHRLGDVHNLPHLTLFQGTFSEDIDYRFIADQLASFYKEHFNPLVLRFQEVSYVPQGWYFYLCNPSKEVQGLHNIALKECRRHIILEESRFSRNTSTLTPAEYAGIRDYGYRYAGEAFLPHITLGRTNGHEDPSILTAFHNKLQELPAETSTSILTVYEMGPDGLHSNTLYAIPLSASHTKKRRIGP